ncbi:MAG TPA: M23 family metallopeptidase [Spirochaetota bacterium]|nr:M23 family metallopeptidase [Spirochaetota bacterium]
MKPISEASARGRTRAVFFAGALVVLGAVACVLWLLLRQTDFLEVESVEGGVRWVGRNPETGQAFDLRPEPGKTHDGDVRVLLEPGARLVLSVLERGRLVVEGPSVTTATQSVPSADIRLFKLREDWWRLDEGRAWLVPASREDGDQCHDLRFSLDVDTTNLRAGGFLRLALRLGSTNTVSRVGGMLADASLILVPRPGGREYSALAGLDCMPPAGILRLAVWVHGRDGAWYMRAWQMPVEKFREDREGLRFLARQARPFPGSAYPPAPADWWQRWLQKKESILSGGKPEREYWRLQKIYRASGEQRGEWPVKLRIPIARYDRVSSPFGVVRYLTSTNGKAHRGIDFAFPEGVDVVAPMEGRVAFAHETAVHGGLVILDHGDGVFSTFMHLSRVIASSNARVGTGSPVGLVGTTGLSTGPHLHYELRIGNRCVDPTPWFVKSPLAGQPDWIRLPD